MAGWVRTLPYDESRYLLLLRSEEHFYVKMQSLGMDQWMFEDAIRLGIVNIVIAYTGRENKVTVYVAGINVWKERGFPVSYEGFDTQVQLLVKFMRVWETDR